MGAPISLGRRCGLCGGQVTLTVRTNGGTYTDDLTALLQATIDDTLIVEAHCDCPHPRSVTIEGSTHPTS